jgi:hypothetical protein
MVSSGEWTVADASVYPTWMPDNPAIQRFGIFFPGTPPVITPEPGGVALLGSGLLGLALLWRRRARRVRKPRA